MSSLRFTSCSIYASGLKKNSSFNAPASPEIRDYPLRVCVNIQAVPPYKTDKCNSRYFGYFIYAAESKKIFLFSRRRFVPIFSTRGNCKSLKWAPSPTPPIKGGAYLSTLSPGGRGQGCGVIDFCKRLTK